MHDHNNNSTAVTRLVISYISDMITTSKDKGFQPSVACAPSQAASFL